MVDMTGLGTASGEVAFLVIRQWIIYDSFYRKCLVHELRAELAGISVCVCVWRRDTSQSWTRIDHCVWQLSYLNVKSPVTTSLRKPQ